MLSRFYNFVSPLFEQKNRFLKKRVVDGIKCPIWCRAPDFGPLRSGISIKSLSVCGCRAFPPVVARTIEARNVDSRVALLLESLWFSIKPASKIVGRPSGKSPNTLCTGSVAGTPAGLICRSKTWVVRATLICVRRSSKLVAADAILSRSSRSCSAFSQNGGGSNGPMSEVRGFIFVELGTLPQSYMTCK